MTNSKPLILKAIGSIAVMMLCLCDTIMAQGYRLTGSIRDATDHSLLIGAAVSIAPVRDTTQIVGVTTDTIGNFEIDNVTRGTYVIKVTYVGYENLTRYLRIDSADKNIGSLKMQTENTTFKSVTVTGKLDPVQMKNDTAEYNAATFKTNPDATAEDLLNKMPGITSNNGTVTAHGETVQKVLVDGKEFFGDDATAAIKNLPAEVIDKVQVFDRLSDQSAFTGFDDGNSQKTINITTKKGRNNGVFGKLYAGYGYLTDSRYSVGGNINWFHNDRRLSVIGMSNDINQQNFASQDLLGVSGGGGGRGGGGRGGGGGGGGSNAFLVGQQGGISTTSSLGLNYTDVWGKKKKVKVAASYFLNITDNTTITSLTRQYYLAGRNTTLYNENDSSRSMNQNQRINFRLEYAADSNNSLIFTPKFIYQRNSQYYDLAGQTLLDSKEQGRTGSEQFNYNSGYNVSADLLYQHKFAKKFRTFSIDVGTTINNKNGFGNQNSYTYSDSLNNYVPLLQQNTVLGRSYTLNGNMSLTEPAGSSGMVQLNYTPSITWNRSDLETDTLNHTENTYTMLDTILSSKYNNTYTTQRAGISYRLRGKNLNFMFGVNGQQALLNGFSQFPTSYEISRTFLSILPIAMFNYKFKNTSTLRIFYRTSTSAPSISQLQSVINNSNPLLLSTGNPNLDQSYTQNLLIRYGLAKGKKGQSFFAFANISNTFNNVVNATVIPGQDTLIDHQVVLHRGSQLTLPVNINATWSANTFLTYGIAINKIKCNLNLSTGFSYTRTPGLVNNTLSLSNTYVPTGTIVLSSNISEKIDFTLSYIATYNVVNNSLQTTVDNNYFTHTGSAKFNWLFWKGFVFNSSLLNTFYKGASNGFNQDIFIWNVALGYKFLKDKSLDVRASINDLLNQNSGLSRTVIQTYIEDDRSIVLRRYALLTVTWTMRYFKKGGGPPSSASPRQSPDGFGGYGGYGH